MRKFPLLLAGGVASVVAAATMLGSTMTTSADPLPEPSQPLPSSPTLDEILYEAAERYPFVYGTGELHPDGTYTISYDGDGPLADEFVDYVSSRAADTRISWENTGYANDDLPAIAALATKLAEEMGYFFAGGSYDPVSRTMTVYSPTVTDEITLGDVGFEGDTISVKVVPGMTNPEPHTRG